MLRVRWRWAGYATGQRMRWAGCGDTLSLGTAELGTSCAGHFVPGDIAFTGHRGTGHLMRWDTAFGGQRFARAHSRWLGGAGGVPVQGEAGAWGDGSHAVDTEGFDTQNRRLGGRRSSATGACARQSALPCWTRFGRCGHPATGARHAQSAQETVFRSERCSAVPAD
jgi:hypothetical protein